MILPSRLRGVPDLVVEILSPSTAHRDQSLKKTLYEGHGVPEYWVVDIDDHCIYRYVLAAAAYAEPERCTDHITFTAVDVTLDLTEVRRRL